MLKLYSKGDFVELLLGLAFVLAGEAATGWRCLR